MKNWKAMVLGVVVLSASALGVKAAVDARRPQGTDVDQLQAMLLQGEQAAEKGDAGGIHALISPNYRDDLGMKDTQLKYQVSRYLREHPGLELTIPTDSVQVDVAPDGKTATVDFVVSATSARGSASRVPIHLKMAKEPVFYYFVFPGEEWKVISASGYPGMELGF